MSTKPVKSRFICLTLTHPMNTMCWRWEEKKTKNIFCLNKSCDHTQLQTFRSLPVRKVSAISISCCSVFSWHPFGGGEGWCLFVRKLIELLLSPILWVSLWAGTHFSAAIVMEKWPGGIWESGGERREAGTERDLARAASQVTWASASSQTSAAMRAATPTQLIAPSLLSGD